MKYLPFNIIIFSLIFTFSNGVTIMSVDFGSEWMKIAVVAPGIPMEIALNKESKRKTPVAISYRGEERTFGDDALSAGMKSPASNYFYLLDLLGKAYDNPMVEIYKQRFPYYNIEADPVRGTVIFRHDKETTYSVEELVAQILGNAQELAMKHTNQRIKDIVITVPPFFNQAERRALLDAAELADLKVLSLMSSNAAIALNYGMFRRKEINETSQNIIFYDMGASSTIASIASYQTVKTKDRGYIETNPQVTILGVGYDRTLGGLEMQLKLRDFLAKKFNEMKKTTNNAFESPRALSRLMKEAGKLKNVLSANTEHLSQVEGVLDDQDFRLKVTRQEFEELCTDFYPRVRGPIDAALVSAGIDISEIHQFIIIGGNTRVPKIQSILQQVWGKELGKNINADEAAALGAVYRAADLGQGFKVMKFHVKESIVYPIEVDFERQVEKDDGLLETKTVKRSLFALSNSYPQKKVMTFNKHTNDFSFSVNYGEMTHLSKDQIQYVGKNHISYIMVQGVTAAFKKHLDDGAESKGIKAHFSMDDSGILSLSSIEAIFDKNVTAEVEKEEESTLSKIGSTLSKLFSGSEDDDLEGVLNMTDIPSKSEKSNGSDKNNKKDTDESKNDKKTKNAKGDEKKDKKEKEFKSKLITLKEELNFTVNYLDLKPITAENVKLSKAKIESINNLENARMEKEQLKNTLEGYILDILHKLSEQEYTSASTEESRQIIKDLAAKHEEWLYDEGFDAEPSAYKDRLRSLEKLFEPIKSRVKEHEQRPEALKALHNMINMTSMFLYSAQNAPEEEKYFTEVEMKTLDDLIISIQKWIEEKEEEQENTPAHVDPKLPILSIAEKISSLDREVKYLVNKAKLAKAKKEREEAEARRKEAAAKAKAEREAAKKSNISDNEEAEVAEEPEEETTLEAEDSESGFESPFPMEDEADTQSPDEDAQENNSEKNRRKDDDEDKENLDEAAPMTNEEESHVEL